MKNCKKYLKLFVSVSLIMGLICPTFATITTTDGSAFVTKAEFDSALSDFNSRLTTFEAGINSKIDSQVSTYLDRNGIWKAKEQDLTAKYMYHNQYDATARTLNLTNGTNGFTSATGAYQSTLAIRPSTPTYTTFAGGALYIKNFLANQEIVKEINKAGLMHIQASVYNTNVVSGITGNNGRDIYYTAANDSNFVNYNWWGMKIYEQKGAESSIKTQVELMNLNFDAPTSNHIYNHYVVNAGYNQLFFFVSKNTRLYYDYIFQIYTARGDTPFPSNGSFSSNGGTNTGVLVVFDVCEVY